MVYFLIFEIFKFTNASKFYYGSISEENMSNLKPFLKFVLSFLTIAYFYIIPILNVRICKAELDLMSKILEQPQFK